MGKESHGRDQLCRPARNGRRARSRARYACAEGTGRLGAVLSPKRRARLCLEHLSRRSRACAHHLQFHQQFADAHHGSSPRFPLQTKQPNEQTRRSGHVNTLLSGEKRALLSKMLRQKGLHASTAARIRPRSVSSPCPCSPAQQRLWFIDQLGVAGAAYHIARAVRLKGTLDVAALRAALDALVERHESLRTTFRQPDGEAEQVISAHAAFQLQEQFITPEHNRGSETQVREIAAEEARAPFDLRTGPQVRGRLLHLADDEHVLLITM